MGVGRGVRRRAKVRVRRVVKGRMGVGLVCMVGLFLGCVLGIRIIVGVVVQGVEER